MLLLLADAQPDGGAGQTPAPGFDLRIWTLFLIPVLLYLIVLRPSSRRQEQERQTLLSSLKKNDRVVTAGGLIGTVAAIKENEDEVTLRVDDNSNVRVRVTKTSIVKVLSSAAAEAAKE
jgi:preprotein translocase subunit YajC